MRASHRGSLGAALVLAGAFAGCDGNTNNGSVDIFAVTRRASLNTSEKEGNEVCSSPSISADGRYVAFASKSTNLHPDDTDLKSDIFVRDLRTGATILASRATDGATPGAKADGDCFNPKISADGRYVVFDSLATNLHPDDVDTTRDIYLRDLLTGTTALVSWDDGLGQKLNDICRQPVVSEDGRYVAFLHGTGGATSRIHVYLRDLVGLTLVKDISTDPSGAAFTTRDSKDIAISSDGRFVAFCVNVAPSVDSMYQVFVRNWQAAVPFTVLASQPSGTTGTIGNDDNTKPALSSDGRYVAFESTSTNLIDAGLDSNGTQDIYVRDLVDSTTVRVSNANAGTEAIGSCSSPAISADGRYVAFVSEAANLVNGDTNHVADVFVRDTVGRTTVRVSVRTYGAEANDASGEPAITADGRWVAFTSVATDLVEGDNNNTTDVFVRGPLH